MYIKASSTISHQPTFRNKGFSWQLSELNPFSALLTPDYSAFIPAMERRRMSEVLKMSIACSIDCLEQAQVSQPDAIIVGTAMGCSIHTKNFLDKIIDANEGLLSPTSFIVSTHNTIAGQIALLLKNHGYNMTHTQNTLSFEQALIDGILCINNGSKNVLIGAADEEETTIYNMKGRLDNDSIHLSCGASFFILSGEKNKALAARVADVATFGLTDDPASLMKEFMTSNNLLKGQIDLVLYANGDQNKTKELETIFGTGKIFDYQKITGTYFTNSAFAMDYAIDILSQQKHPAFDTEINKVLVCNNLIPENLGLILLDTQND